MIKDAGAREIHFRVGAPPITHSCYFGVDTPERSELMAAQKTVREIRSLLEAESLGFISADGLRKALDEQDEKTYCMACFTGRYPMDTGSEISKQPTDGNGPGLFDKA